MLLKRNLLLQGWRSWSAQQRKKYFSYWLAICNKSFLNEDQDSKEGGMRACLVLGKWKHIAYSIYVVWMWLIVRVCHVYCILGVLFYFLLLCTFCKLWYVYNCISNNIAAKAKHELYRKESMKVVFMNY